MASLHSGPRQTLRSGEAVIAEWFPNNPPIYDIEKSYAENAKEGPFFKGEIPKRAPSKRTFDLFGHQVKSPLGVPAGPLLNSRWIALAAKLGFDVPTYKTIRSMAHPGHPPPNVIYVKPTGPHRAMPSDPSNDLSDFTITNSFGMPSMSPDFLIQDIARANASLSIGQVMIVSVVGTPFQGLSFADDFVRAAVLAKEAGAKIIEANFSCPNVDKAEGSLYTSAETVYEYAKKISNAIRPLPLILKVGLFQNPEQMKQVFLAAARGGANAVCGLNAVSMDVVDAKGSAPLGESRRSSGVCGGSIRPQALHFIHSAAELIRKEKLGLLLLACGGITRPEHFDLFLDAGAQFALAATGMMWDPYLALRYHERKNHGRSTAHP